MTASRYQSAAEAVFMRLSRGGAEHSVRVADTAARLAGLYGADVDDARIAGVLHDWCRDIPGPELVRLAEDAGIPVTEVDRRVPYLLHAPVAAVVLPSRLPWLSQRVLDAIVAHTYGRADIEALGMIVYIADAIEPGRTHEGVDELRDAVGVVTLSELFERAYVVSVRHLIDGRRQIHPATVQVWNALVAGERQ
ncbi:MAG: bis(5'-nucleosyl)-tetraphosphatase (symmetrical) YqeK [Coriobacteriia bacterium]|nr:bis(5'-nucleosyl)-tetraphosphatase (symmetrical) YqeK [Coriobacteriia bacterium]